MKNVYVSGNTFHDNSAVIRNEYHYSNYNIKELLNEIIDLKEKLNSQTELYKALSELAEAIEAIKDSSDHKKHSSVGKIIKKYAKEFASSFFVGIASNALINFIQNFS